MEESEGRTGLVTEAACAGECGRWVIPVFGSPHPTTCQRCYYDSLNAVDP